MKWFIMGFLVLVIILASIGIAVEGSEPNKVYLPIITREDGRSVCVWEGGPWTEPPDCWCTLYPGEPWDYVPMGCSDRPFPLPTATP